MGKNVSKGMIIALCALALWGCQPGASDTRTKGIVVSVSKTHLVLQDASTMMFVTITAEDKARLKGLKKGDLITLVGKTTEGNEHSMDIIEVITASGQHIPLGG